jgi:hypothetical protein
MPLWVSICSSRHVHHACIQVCERWEARVTSYACTTQTKSSNDSLLGASAAATSLFGLNYNTGQFAQGAIHGQGAVSSQAAPLSPWQECCGHSVNAVIMQQCGAHPTGHTRKCQTCGQARTAAACTFVPNTLTSKATASATT